MKICFLLPFLAICLTSYSQNGIVTKDTLILNNSLKFVKGATILLGKGSKSDGGYAFISTDPITAQKKVLGMPVALTSRWSGYKMKIISFRIIGTELTGTKYYLVLSIGNEVNYLCDPELASEAKEIL